MNLRVPSPATSRVWVLAAGAAGLAGCSEAGGDLVVWLEASADHPLAPLGVIAVFIASGFVAAPLSVVMIPTMVVFGPLEGSLWTAVGATLSGGLFFWLGSRGARLAGRLRRRDADRSRLATLLGRNGVAAVVIARNLPLGPYPVVNLALGATAIRLPQFLVGNLIGLAPWIGLYASTGAEARTLLTSPSPETWWRLAAVVALLVAAGALGSRWLSRRLPPSEPADG
jgi:uncharacterized membrane protein YdjX (TVP38/TMEM64 family)